MQVSNMILLSLKQRRQQERRGWQQPPVRKKMIAKEWIGGTQQSTSDGTQKVWRWKCGNAKRLGGSYRWQHRRDEGGGRRGWPSGGKDDDGWSDDMIDDTQSMRRKTSDERERSIVATGDRYRAV